MTEKKYPIAEMFTSPQGEGRWTGTLMRFIRFAGCTVGKPFEKERYKKLPHCEFKCKGGDPDMGHGPTCAYAKSCNSFLPIYTEKCTIYDGRTMECDTDYRVKERLTSTEIIAQIPRDVKHICITGGEPLMHDLDEFLSMLDFDMSVHIETSGTVMPKSNLNAHDLQLMWITVSPKFGVLEEMVEKAQEIKLLVDEKFDFSKVPDFIKRHKSLYLQPINFENEVNEKNLKLCLDLQLDNPEYIISTQAHKLWSVR